MHFGVDVSSNNAHPMNYTAIVSALMALGSQAQPFAIVKITQGIEYVNPKQAVDIAGFRKAGAVVAGYLMDEGLRDPNAEEALFNQTVKLPQADDIELPEGMNVSQYITHSNELIAVDPDALSYLNQSEVTEGFPEGAGLWLAEYNNEPAVTSHPCLIHQYTSTGTLPGIPGAWDLNAWCGSEAQFDNFFGIAQATPPTIQEEEMPFITNNGTTQFLVLANWTKVAIDTPADLDALAASGVKTVILSDSFVNSIPTA